VDSLRKECAVMREEEEIKMERAKEERKKEKKKERKEKKRKGEKEMNYYFLNIIHKLHLLSFLFFPFFFPFLFSLLFSLSSFYFLLFTPRLPLSFHFSSFLRHPNLQSDLHRSPAPIVSPAPERGGEGSSTQAEQCGHWASMERAPC
jgi:hypothetical protein